MFVLQFLAFRAVTLYYTGSSPSVLLVSGGGRLEFRDWACSVEILAGELKLPES